MHQKKYGARAIHRALALAVCGGVTNAVLYGSTLRRQHDSYYVAGCMVVVAARQRVLIVDDDEVSRRVTALAFQARDWGVETTPDLRSAIDTAMRQQPHVILTELLLPDVKGFQFARALRSAVDHDIQVVALTRAPAEVFEQARRDGFDLAFSKPLDFDEIERHVRQTTRIRAL